MTDPANGEDHRSQPAPIDLDGIDGRHPDGESVSHRLGTTVAETAIAVTGVHHLGGAAERSLARAARAVIGTSPSPGVTVSTDGNVTTIDLELVVEYPHPVVDVMNETRRQVSHAASQLVPDAITVNVTVTDVHAAVDRRARGDETSGVVESSGDESISAEESIVQPPR